MRELTLDLLAKRFDRLQRENKVFKRITAALLVGIVPLGLMGSNKS
jgi:hypothetical protein